MRNLLLSIFVVLPLLVHGESTRVYLGLGGTHLNFQDTRFSDLRFKNNIISPELGFLRKTDQYIIDANADLNLVLASEHPSLNGTQYQMLRIGIGFSYLKNIAPSLYLGGEWDLLDFTTFSFSDLSNSDNLFITSSNLSAAVIYEYTLNNNWSLQAKGSLGLLGLVKLAPSFTTNFQQIVVDKGKVSFQDAGSRDPFSLNYIDIKPFWEQLYLKTGFEFFYKKRLSFIYQWDMRTIWETKGYPLTQARQNLMIRYSFISR